MNASVLERLEKIELSNPRSYQQFTFFPILGGNGANYITLKRALDTGGLTITEVSEGGSVPELNVENTFEIPVLILDGEEVAGAKQNRVVNTSILLRERSKTRIPVSCTEQGRWRYTSRTFSDSGHVMSRQARAAKSRSVSESLVMCQSYESDQDEVWNEVSRLQQRSGVRSDSDAMRDVYEARRGHFSDLLSAVPLEEGQCGILAFAGSQPLGVELFNSTEAYQDAHEKLLRSYTIDHLHDAAESNEPPAREVVEAFLATLSEIPEESFPSIGYGTDHRYRGKKVVGNALVHEGEVVHAAFLRVG